MMLRAVRDTLVRRQYGGRLKRACDRRGVSGAAQGAQVTEAVELFDRLLGLANDLDLLSEEYDPQSDRLLGNFPQAFTHLLLVNTAYNLSAHPQRPARHRANRKDEAP